MLELRGKSVLVLGAGKEGVEACRYLLSKGSKVLLLGAAAEEEAFVQSAKDFFTKIQAHFGEEVPEAFLKPDLVLCIQAKEKRKTLLDQLRAQEIPIRTGLELACELTSAKLVAVTGTNGKSTTSKMIELMLSQSNIPVTLAGGSFLSFFEAIPAAQKSKIFLLEVNSHQLEEAEVFHPHLSVITNLTRSHRDRHGGTNKYALAKAKIFALQNEMDWMIYNADNQPVVKLTAEAGTKKLPVFISGVPNPFETGEPEGPRVLFRDKKIILHTIDGKTEEYSTEKIKLRAQHDFENAMAAMAAARALGAQPEHIQKVLEEFSGLPHRMQKISSARGVDWYDDSRSSNPASTTWGVWGFQKPIILITGGREIRVDYRPMAPAIKEKVKILILVGQSRNSMKAVLEDHPDMYLVRTLEDAVHLAYAKAEKGDTVVYSPACPPEPGLFSSMEDRGEKYMILIKKELDSDVRDKMAKVRRLPGTPI